MIEEAFQLCLRVYGPENDHSKSMRKLYSNAKARYGPKTAKIVGLFFCSSNSSPILLLQKGLCLDPALQFANKLIYQSELVAGQQNKVNSF